MVSDVRVKFSKTGALQFISHLDLHRTMKTALARAGIPLRYSEGFNPHPRISFVMQLSVGAQSVCEYMDIKIDPDMPYDEIVARLRNALPPELYVSEAYAPQNKPGDVAFAEYDITYDAPKTDLTAFITDPLIVTRRTKSGERESDIRPMIRSYEQKEMTLRVILSASSAAYLNPEYVAHLCGIPDYTILRRRVLLADGETEFR